jgi:hypothetical protein
MKQSMQMNSDLISNNYVDHIDKVKIRRIIKMLQVALILSCTYAAFALVEWYAIFAKPPLQTGSSYYLHRIHPFVSLVLLGGGIWSLAFSVKAYRQVLTSFEDEDPLKYNIASDMYYKLALLTIFLHTLSILSIITRFLLL